VRASDSAHLEDVLNRLRDAPEFERTRTTVILSRAVEHPL
jgi:hypothetical protein